MAPLALEYRNGSEIGRIPIFAHKNCALDESNPYNTPYNMNKVGLMNQMPKTKIRLA